MSKQSPEEKFRHIVQGNPRPLASIQQTIADNLWSEVIGFGRPLTEREIQALAEANFAYDEQTRIARKQRAKEPHLPQPPQRTTEGRGCG